MKGEPMKEVRLFDIVISHNGVCIPVLDPSKPVEFGLITDREFIVVMEKLYAIVKAVDGRAKRISDEIKGGGF